MHLKLFRDISVIMGPQIVQKKEYILPCILD